MAEIVSFQEFSARRARKHGQIAQFSEEGGTCPLREISGPFNDSSLARVRIAEADGEYRFEKIGALFSLNAGDIIINHKNGKLEVCSRDHAAQTYPTLKPQLG